MSKIRAAIFFGLLGMLCCQAIAERADRDRPISYESDALRYDDLKQVSVLSGNVVLTKGTIIIRAAKLEIKKDIEGYQTATAVADAGKRVFFRQKREGVDEFIEAESEAMVYDERADTVQFSRNAVMRRYRGAVLSDETTGAGIFYDNKTESFSVDSPVGAPTSGGASGAAAAGRVRGVLTPRPDATAPWSTSATLRISPSLPAPK